MTRNAPAPARRVASAGARAATLVASTGDSSQPARLSLRRGRYGDRPARPQRGGTRWKRDEFSMYWPTRWKAGRRRIRGWCRVVGAPAGTRHRIFRAPPIPPGPPRAPTRGVANVMRGEETRSSAAAIGDGIIVLARHPQQMDARRGPHHRLLHHQGRARCTRRSGTTRCWGSLRRATRPTTPPSRSSPAPFDNPAGVLPLPSGARRRAARQPRAAGGRQLSRPR